MIALFSLVRKKSWHLSATRLARVRSVVADSFSRTEALELEGSLDDLSFQWTSNHLPNLQVDLFVTEYNYKLPTYVAPNLDPQAFATYAFTLS